MGPTRRRQPTWAAGRSLDLQCEKGRLEPIVRERALQRRPRDRRSVLPHPSRGARAPRHTPSRYYSRNRAGRRNPSAGPHPGVAQRTERMVLVAREHAGGDVAGRTDLEHDPALGELGDQGGILDRADPVRDARDRQRERLRGPTPRPRARRRGRCSRGRNLRRSRRPRANGPGGKPASSPASWKPTTYGWRSSASRRASASADSTPWLRTAAARIRASIPWSRRASSIPAAIPPKCSASVSPTASAWPGEAISST